MAEQTETFDSFNFAEGLKEGLDAMGFKTPTPIQSQAIPIILEKRDVLAVAQTGTGKTAAFLLPILDQLSKNPPTDSVATLIIVPTRELAVQIDQQVAGLGYFCGVHSIPIYGGGDGRNFEQEKKSLSSGTPIVIATPGKLISHLNMGYVKMDKLRYLVLDEADRMLDMGFYQDIMKIISHTNKDRQSLLFSATMPGKMRDLAKKILKNPEQIDIAISKPAEGILQGAYLVYDQQKIGLIQHLFRDKKIPSSIVFSGKKQTVKEIEATLKRLKFNVAAIHSDLDQSKREEVLNHFKHGKIDVLVATDIVARGIDIKGIHLIVNFDVPHDPEDYIHRIGRTARADATGVALTFINEKETHKFSRIEKVLEKEIRKIPLPPELGEGPEYNTKSRPGGSGGYRKNKGSGKNYKGNRNKKR